MVEDKTMDMRVPGKTDQNQIQRTTERHIGFETEFLPAVLEVLDCPPHPLSRIVSLTITLFFSFALVWSIVGQVDMVAVAQGRIVPDARVKVIQPFEIGIIRKIHVKEGQEVKTGEPLIHLDLTEAQANRQRIAEELSTTRARITRVETLLGAIADERSEHPAEISFPSELPSQEIKIQRHLFEQQLRAYRQRMAVLAGQIDRKTWERAAIQRLVEKWRSTLPLISQRSEAIRTLAKEDYAPQNEYLRLQQERMEIAGDLAFQEARLQEISAELSLTTREREAVQSEFHRDLLTELVEARTHANILNKELSKADKRQTLTRLDAPIDGRVQALAVHTVGGVVTPAQELMRIVPRNDTLEVEAWLENKDVGFVKNDQTAEIKLETFPFTKYGVIPGHIIGISADALPHEQLGLAFKVLVRMEKSTMLVNDHPVNLSPGMNVSTEIKIGQRRLIEFFLSPLLRYSQQSLRER